MRSSHGTLDKDRRRPFIHDDVRLTVAEQAAGTLMLSPSRALRVETTLDSQAECAQSPLLSPARPRRARFASSARIEESARCARRAKTRLATGKAAEPTVLKEPFSGVTTNVPAR
jgi:hypothetical protein